MKKTNTILLKILLGVIITIFIFYILIIFWMNVLAYTGFIIAFLIGILVYYLLSKKTNLLNNKKKKIIAILSLVLSLTIILCAFFATVDYVIAKNNKEPIFKYIGAGTLEYDICPEIGSCTKESLPKSKMTYYGLGYEIVACNYCSKSVSLHPLGITWFTKER